MLVIKQSNAGKIIEESGIMEEVEIEAGRPLKEDFHRNV